MNIFYISTPTETKKSLPVQLFADILMIVSETTKLKNIDDFSPYLIVALKTGTFITNEKTQNGGLLAKSENLKKDNWAILDKEKIFEIDIDNNNYFAGFIKGEIILNKDKSVIESSMKELETLPKSFTLEEKSAWQWLEKDETGTSSLAMCLHLLPNTQSHYKMENMYESDWLATPLDTSDFKLCLGLLSSVPSLKSRLQDLETLSPQWSKLVKNWTAIEDLLKQPGYSAHKNAYEIINNCNKKEAPTSVKAP